MPSVGTAGNFLISIGSYGYEMTAEEHRQLAKVLNAVKGLVAISNYQCDLMDELYPSPKWRKHLSPLKTIHSTKDKRQEVLWVNYDILQLKNAYTL